MSTEGNGRKLARPRRGQLFSDTTGDSVNHPCASAAAVARDTSSRGLFYAAWHGPMATLVLLLALTLMLGVVAFTGIVGSHYAASGESFLGEGWG
jgi:hypothetical protein